MLRKKADLITKTFKLHKSQQQMLDECMEKLAILSEAEVVRQALTFFHMKKCPPYLEPSPTQLEKEKRLKEQQRLENMSGREYVEQIVHGLIMKGRDGVDYCLYHGYANDIRVIEVDKAREYFKEYEGTLNNHLKVLMEYTIDEKLKYWKDVLIRDYGFEF